MITVTDLHGAWVEVEEKTDTLTFSSLEEMEIVSLDRGFEWSNGYLLPKSGSGPYVYKLYEDRIDLNWMLSSNAQFETFGLSLIDKRMYIGNFYDPNRGATLVFDKIQ